MEKVPEIQVWQSSILHGGNLNRTDPFVFSLIAEPAKDRRNSA